ncbi:nucleotidyl transferase AbiEii/AbiGii toxin family protein [Candidatus Marsarchaeota archaeon]|jgi:predicted nucleotidyltransferase component of viral defense system|nr:nucleotidyl transferase AbiEii/AbiGii toxin family protein [Candidatus Marsarchaeota archaeon]MCL5099978.1 nucleotidyl transferase AbiEii/AbiGii toxin family protein [Candidatus Marsarchaeota archaeon]
MDIRDASQTEKAKLEDALVELLYSKYAGLVFHGGTSIWRCYGGNRFSRDLDFYLDAKTSEDKMRHYKELSDFLKESGFSMKEKGYENATDTMHFLVESNTKMKIDINFKYKNGKESEYTKIDGSKIVVLSLSPLELLNEKIATYEDKLDNAGKFKHPEANDLYDIYYLTSLIDKRDATTVKRLRSLLNKINGNPPPDIGSLGHLIIAGLPPSFEMMIDRIKRWLDGNS